jgi:putative serine/threonine protein kinase
MEFQNSQLLKFIDYPESREEKVREILKTLAKHNVEIKAFMAKGFRSTVFKGLMGEKEVAVKILRSDVNKRDALSKECSFLKQIKGIAPKPFICEDSFIVMEFIRGEPLQRVLKSADREKAKKLILKTINVCHQLDLMKIKHSELKGGKHIVVSDGKIRLLDFESASYSENPRNVLQFVGSYIVGKREILEKLGLKEEELLAALKIYKRYPKKGLEKIKENLDRDC